MNNAMPFTIKTASLSGLNHLVVLFIIYSFTNFAYPVDISSGSILQGIQSQVSTFNLPHSDAKHETQRPTINDSRDIKFSLYQINFTGNYKIPYLDLQKIIAKYLNHPLTFNELRYITDEVVQYYSAHGILAKALLPEQEITNGVLSILIIEASVGGILINNQSKRVDKKRIETWINSVIPVGTKLSLIALERAVLTLNDQPDLQVTSSFSEGQNHSETQLILTVTDKPLIIGSFSTDNYGQTSTGNNRASMNFSLNGFFEIGEEFNFFGLYSKGSSYTRLALNLPLKSSGLRAGINTSYLHYDIINPSFSQLNLNGTSSTVGTEFTYPLIRSRPSNIYVSGNYNFSTFTNSAILSTINQYNTSVYQTGLYGNGLDNILGGGFNSSSLIISNGLVNLNNSPSLPLDTVGPKINGGFSKLRYSINRNQVINSYLSAYLGLTGQFASKNLDSSEQIYFGGPYAVRAYASGQANASQGEIMTFELSQFLPMGLILTEFYDYSNLDTFKNTNFQGAPLQNSYSLQGFGGSLGWAGEAGIKIKATFAVPTGSLTPTVNQALTGSGGTSNRLWLTASIPF